MAWEIRHGANLYYYKKERRGDSVRSVYAGRGEWGLLMYSFDNLERSRAEVERAQESERRERAQEIDQTVKGLSQLARILEQAAFLAAGYRQHKRQWRKVKNDADTNL